MSTKKILRTLICTLLISNYLYTQTEVSGGIFDDTNWTLANSPYIVTDDVVVFPENTLTIEPGVEIRFNSGTTLELRDGNLIAIGDETNQIKFTLNEDEPAAAPKWEGIFNNPQTPDTVIIDLKYVTLEYAKDGIDYGGGYALRYIDNSTFQYNDRAVFDGGWGYNWITINNSSFIQNGIGMEGRQSAFDCHFDGNGVAFANPLYFNNSQEGGRVHNCTFENNGKAIATIGQGVTYANIYNCDFVNNDTTLFIYQADMLQSSVTDSEDLGVYIVKGYVDNCFFSNNQVGVQVGMFPNSLEIKNNTITQNEYGIWVDGPGALIFDNIVCDNNSQNAYNNSESPVNLSNNCWCLSTLDEIRETVYDAYDDVSVGIAILSPFQTTCLQGLVYPGDTNNDGVANAWDLLNIGLGFGEEGLPRDNASSFWTGQEAPDWESSFINELNYKYADTNGDAIIDINDIAALQNNYGSAHALSNPLPPVVESTNTYELILQPQGELEIGSPATIDIILATSGNPIDNLYGLAFAVTSESPFFEPGTFQLNTSGSWLGDETNMLELTNAFDEDGRVEIALVKTDFLPSSGFGLIASMQFVMSEDIIAALTGGNEEALVAEELMLKVEDIQAINETGVNLVVENEATTLVVTSTKELLIDQASFIDVFPNPVKETLNLQYGSDIEIEQINLYDATAQLSLNYSEGSRVLDLHDLESGIYILTIQTAEYVLTKRIVKR